MRRPDLKYQNYCRLYVKLVDLFVFAVGIPVPIAVATAVRIAIPVSVAIPLGAPVPVPVPVSIPVAVTAAAAIPSPVSGAGSSSGAGATSGLRTRPIRRGPGAIAIAARARGAARGARGAAAGLIPRTCSAVPAVGRLIDSSRRPFVDVTCRASEIDQDADEADGDQREYEGILHQSLAGIVLQRTDDASRHGAPLSESESRTMENLGNRNNSRICARITGASAACDKLLFRMQLCCLVRGGPRAIVAPVLRFLRESGRHFSLTVL